MNRILLAFLLVLLGMGSSTLAQVNPRTPTWTAYNSVPQAYTVTDLGQLAPTAINALGQVVGNYNNEAYIWDKWRGMRGLGLLPGGTFSWAAAINDSGVVTGTADGNGTVLPGNIFTSDPEQECSDLTQPFIWRQKMLGLGTVVASDGAEFGTNCISPFYGADINNRGEVVGYTAYLFDDYQWGFSWNASTASAGESLFGNSFSPSFALGLNNSGLIVGANGGFGIAHSWKNGVATDLGGLADFAISAANAVNDIGQIVGWSDTNVGCVGVVGDKCIHAVLWTQAGAVDLGTLPGDTDSAAVKINLYGLVIGASGSSTIGGGAGPLEVVGRPFIWSKQGGMKDLNTLIPANSGWVLNSAAGINFWGQIVGSGTLNGQSHGFLLTPKL